MSDDSDGVDGVDTDSGLLEPDESLEDTGVEDVLDEGYSPPERPLALNDWGLTAREAAGHESLDRRLAREIPDPAEPDGDGLGDSADSDGELYDDQVGDARSGRLTSYDAAYDNPQYSGEASDNEDSLDVFAVDVGVDGAGASAEEAAMHVVPDLDDDR